MSKLLDQKIADAMAQEQRELAEAIQKYGTETDGIYTIDFTKSDVDELPMIVGNYIERPNNFLVRKVTYDPQRTDRNRVIIHVVTYDEREGYVLFMDEVFIGHLRTIMEYIPKGECD